MHNNHLNLCGHLQNSIQGFSIKSTFKDFKERLNQIFQKSFCIINYNLYLRQLKKSHSKSYSKKVTGPSISLILLGQRKKKNLEPDAFSDK